MYTSQNHPVSQMKQANFTITVMQADPKSLFQLSQDEL